MAPSCAHLESAQIGPESATCLRRQSLRRYDTRECRRKLFQCRQSSVHGRLCTRGACGLPRRPTLEASSAHRLKLKTKLNITCLPITPLITKGAPDLPEKFAAARVARERAARERNSKQIDKLILSAKHIIISLGLRGDSDAALRVTFKNNHSTHTVGAGGTQFWQPCRCCEVTVEEVEDDGGEIGVLITSLV